MIRLRGCVVAPASLPVETNNRRTGSGTSTPSGTKMNAPSWKKAVLSAANAASSIRACRPRCSSSRAGSDASAATRFASFTPAGTGPSVESSFANCPFTNTSRGPGTRAKVNWLKASLLTPCASPSKAGRKGSRAMGATLVKRQSSCLGVGKPSSAKRAIPALRSGKSHAGCLACFSNRSNFARYGSMGRIAVAASVEVVVGIVAFNSNYLEASPFALSARRRDDGRRVRFRPVAIRR